MGELRLNEERKNSRKLLVIFLAVNFFTKFGFVWFQPQMEAAISSGSGFEPEADLSDSDSDALTINEDILEPIVEIKEEAPDTNWKVKKKRTRVKRRSDENSF